MITFVDQYFYVGLFIYGIIRILFLIIPFMYKFITLKNDTLMSITTNDIIKLSNSIEKLSDTIIRNEINTIKTLENHDQRLIMHDNEIEILKNKIDLKTS
jgi:hypothetical protein